MEDERRPAAAAASAVSKVLDDDDLLIEILLRVGFPTTLVRAALVCKRWLGHISNRAFLRHFRELHPPRLLGFYIEDGDLPTATPPFVPMQPQPPELAAIIRRARFDLDASRSHYIHVCRNGSLFITWYGRGCADCTEHRPLSRRPARCVAVALPAEEHKPQAGYHCIFSQVLSKEEEDDGMSYFHLYVESTDGNPGFRVHLFVPRDGSWIPRHPFPLVIDQHPHPRFQHKAVLFGNKIYVPAGLSQIIVLDLMDSSYSTIQLPQGVEHGKRGNTMLARAHDASGVYLIHVEEFKLRIWLHKVDNWLLVDTIWMRDMCANLRISGCVDEDEHTDLLINQVGDYSESLFFKMGRYGLHLEIKSRTLRKVYETKDGNLGNAYPFMMIWPPKFPALKYDPARFVFWPLDDLYTTHVEAT